MERLPDNRRPGGITAAGVRVWGILFLLAGMIGVGVIQNKVMGLANMNQQQMLALLDSSNSAMVMAAAALLLQMLEACAVPVFAFLLVEGFWHTKDFAKYLLRVAGVAILSEIPYNLVMGGSWFVLSSRNPVFAMALCLVLLYFYRRYAGKTAANIAIKLAVTVAAALWCVMLKIDHGIFCVIMVAVIYLMRDKKALRVLVGCVAAVLCSTLSLYYMAAPLSFLILHFYNDEQGDANRLVCYLSYPVLLTLAAVATVLL